MSFNSKYEGEEVEELLDKLKSEDRSKLVTTDTAQTIDGVKTFTNYVIVKRNPDNDSIMHMGQNAKGEGMIYLDSTSSLPMFFYNNTPNGEIQIKCLKADGVPNFRLTDRQWAAVVKGVNNRTTGIFGIGKHENKSGVGIGTAGGEQLEVVYPKMPDDDPEIASVTVHGDIIMRALKGEYENNNYVWFRYDPNNNTLNIAAFEAIEGAGDAMDLVVQINGKVVAKLDDLEGKVDKIEGKGLSTEDFTTALKNKLSGLNNYDDTALSNAISSLQTQLNTLVSGNPSDAINSFNEIIAFLDGIKDNQDLSSIIASIEQQIAGKMDKVTLAAVATSGSYNDLKDKPTIPSAVTESTVSGWGFTKNTGTYSKPSGGIPKTDLASAVQTLLNKADTALQSEQYKGTVTSVKINGATKTPDTNGVVDLGTIEGGGGSSSGSGAYAEVNHGTSDTTFTLTPNTFHVWDEVTALDLSFADEQAGVANEYLFQFTSGATPTTLTLPDVKWANDAAPVIEANKIYQISVLKGLGSVLSFSNEIKLFPVTLVVGETSQQGADVYAYMYDKYGEITTSITEEMYFIRDADPIAVGIIEYGTFEGLTGYWLNGYISMNFKQVLTQDGSLIKRFPIDPGMT